MLLLLLVLLSTLTVAWSSSSRAETSATLLPAPLGSADNPLRLCVQPNPPFSFADNSSGKVDVYGYEPCLANALVKTLGLQSQTSIIPATDDLLSYLLRPQSDPLHCDLGMAGLKSVDLGKFVDLGVKISTTIFRNGMSVATLVRVVRASDLWTFGHVLAPDLWVALVISAFGLALLVYAVEHDYKRRTGGKIAYPMELQPGLVESFHQAFCKLVNNCNGIPASSVAAKLMSLAWGFVILVVISSYTAGLTASMSVASFQSPITSFKDLSNSSNPGLVIGSWSNYSEAGLFDRYGFRPVGLPWSSPPDVEAMLDMLAAGDLDALVLDTAMLRHGIGARCDVQLVGPVFLYSEVVLVLHGSVAPALHDRLNDGLLGLQAAGMNEELEGVYMYQQQDTCNPYDLVSAAISFSMVRGVFIVLGAFTGLGLLLAVLPKLSRRCETDSRVDEEDCKDSSVRRLRAAFSRLSSRAESVNKVSALEPRDAAAVKPRRKAGGSRPKVYMQLAVPKDSPWTRASALVSRKPKASSGAACGGVLPGAPAKQQAGQVQAAEVEADADSSLLSTASGTAGVATPEVSAPMHDVGVDANSISIDIAGDWTPRLIAHEDNEVDGDDDETGGQP